MLNVVRRWSWAPPHVDYAVLTAFTPPPAYQLGKHFTLVTREPGSERLDLPIWKPSANAVDFSSSYGPVQRTDVEGVPGAFVLSNVLSASECSAVAALSEAMGYTPDAPVSLARNIRRNENCVIIADDTLWQPIWERVREHMPPVVEGGSPAGLNQRWRLYKYGESDIFRLHTDGSWPGSAVREGKLVRDAFGDRWSQLTFLIYLDADYDGGETSFFVPTSPRDGEMVSVRVPQGSVLCFFHGEHELSLLHEGSLVTRGLKRIVRSDVLYYRRGAQHKDGL